jgi:3-dehydroquinate synthase
MCFEWMAATVQALAACEPEAVARLIRRCDELHLQHVATSGDPFELGSAGRSASVTGWPTSSSR